jgi:hypothetical protein
VKKVSILISSHNRLPLFRRTLFSIGTNLPKGYEVEVVLADDGSTEDIKGELRKWNASFAWKFINVDVSEFEAYTGMKKLHNNPCLTNNIAFKHCTGDLIIQQGNEVIATRGCYDRLLASIPDLEYYMVATTTYDVNKENLVHLNENGSNISEGFMNLVRPWELQSPNYRSDVTNYLSIAPRCLWDRLRGYDELYYAGISAEDSDFVRRARTIPGFNFIVCDAVSLHQYHGGISRYYKQSPTLMPQQKWDEAVAVNKAIYHSWSGKTETEQQWPWGTLGVKSVEESPVGARA